MSRQSDMCLRHKLNEKYNLKSRFMQEEMKRMKHCGTQRLETERLILRRFVREDADAMYKNWASGNHF